MLIVRPVFSVAWFAAAAAWPNAGRNGVEVHDWIAPLGYLMKIVSRPTTMASTPRPSAKPRG